MSLLERWRRWLAARAERAKDSRPCPDEMTMDDADDEAIDPFNPFPEPVRLEITDILDLHTIPPRDVRRVVEEYLLEAHRLGFCSVRLIHGKGRGVQRELVRSILARTPFVVSWTDAPPAAGGIGATIAHLSPANTRTSFNDK